MSNSRDRKRRTLRRLVVSQLDAENRARIKADGVRIDAKSRHGQIVVNAGGRSFTMEATA